MPLELYAPPDVHQAYDAWGAACGPAAVAAVLGVTVESLRPHLGSKRWANPTDIMRTLTALGVRFTSSSSVRQLPERALAFIQIAGPWLEPGVPVAAAYRHTHWIAMHGDAVYDINVGDAGGWISRHEWERTIVPEIVAATKRATGWRVRQWIELPS